MFFGFYCKKSLRISRTAQTLRNLKTHQMFSVHTTPVTGHFGFVFGENSPREITWLSWRHRFRKALLSFQNVFRPHENEKPAFSNSSALKNIFEKFRILIRDGLVWKVGVTVETKLRFQIPPALRDILVGRVAVYSFALCPIWDTFNVTRKTTSSLYMFSLFHVVTLKRRDMFTPCTLLLTPLSWFI